MNGTRYRKFLNDIESGGMATVRFGAVSTPRSGHAHEVEGHPRCGLDAEFAISDCTKEACLEFNVDSWGKPDDKAEKITKLRQKAKRLRKAILTFEKLLNAELDAIEAHLPVEREWREKEKEAEKAAHRLALPLPSYTLEGAPVAYHKGTQPSSSSSPAL